ncbi:MAG: hypothetical protein RLZZ422_2158 [Pseudomonadota bacterium]|jgi:hypothetical protein
MLENHSTSNRIESSPTAPDYVLRPIETELVEESLILERVQGVLEQLNANEDNDRLSPLFELCLQELERTKEHRGRAILRSRELERLAAKNPLPSPVAPISTSELNQIGLDLGKIRTNCIALMHFCEDSFHFNPSAFGELDFNNHDAYLLSSNAVETATKWAKRLAEGGV